MLHLLIVLFMVSIECDLILSQTTDKQEILVVKPNTFVTLSGAGCPAMGCASIGTQFPLTNPNFTADLGYGGFYKCFCTDAWNIKLLIVVKENIEPQFTITPNKNISHGDNLTIHFKHEFDAGSFTSDEYFVIISNGNMTWNRTIMTLNTHYTRNQWTLFNGSVNITADYLRPNFTYLWMINKSSIPFLKKVFKTILLEIQAPLFNISVNATVTHPCQPVTCTALGNPEPDYKWVCSASSGNMNKRTVYNSSIHFHNVGIYSCVCTAYNVVYGKKIYLDKSLCINVTDYDEFMESASHSFYTYINEVVKYQFIYQLIIFSIIKFNINLFV